MAWFLRRTLLETTAMNRILLILIFTAACVGTSSAQQGLTMGIRQGVGMWFTKDGIGNGSFHTAEGDHFSWNKEIFARQEFSKKWAYEVSVINYHLDSRHDVREETKMISTNRNTQYIETGLSFQYDVTYPLAGYMFPALRGMKSFVGFGVFPRISFEDVTITTIGNDASRVSDIHSANNFALFLGFNYTHIVPLTQRLSLTSVFSVKMKPFDQNIFSNRDFSKPNRQVSVATGLSYRL